MVFKKHNITGERMTYSCRHFSTDKFHKFCDFRLCDRCALFSMKGGNRLGDDAEIIVQSGVFLFLSKEKEFDPIFTKKSKPS